MEQEPTSTVIKHAIEQTMPYVAKHIEPARELAFSSLDIPHNLLHWERKSSGKVREIFFAKDIVVLVCTDRLSGFDRHLVNVPFKGQVLNMTSLWWFKEAKEKLNIPNAVLDSPDPNVTVAKNCEPFPIEFVMRGYMTGSTSTSIWKNYSAGMRTYCGVALPDGIAKNERLPMGNILTPTTKSDVHDELISAEEIVSRGFMKQEDYDVCAKYAKELFDFGQRVAAERGLILVDTKYEFGRDQQGNVVLIDEVHTPDSSRYWVADTYDALMAQGKDPQNVDKEFVRKWYASNCDPYATDVALPTCPPDLVCELSRRYVMLYELITGEKFVFPEPKDVGARVQQHVEEYLKAHHEKQ